MKKKIDLKNDEFIVDCTNNTVEERKEVYKFLVEHRGYSDVYLRDDYPVIVCNKKEGDSNFNNIKDTLYHYPYYPVYKFEEFKIKYLSNPEIIGYKLIKPEYKEAISKIVGECISTPFDEYINVETFPIAIMKLEKAGVLDLWFKPVYEIKEKFITVGNFSVKITQNGIFHKDENITSFVEEMMEHLHSLTNISKFSKWNVKINEIIFDYTGCECSKSTFSEWSEVWELYKNLSS